MDTAGTESVAGDWHLLEASATERRVPRHRLDLRFKVVQGQLEGTVLNRVTGAEMPLAALIQDGPELHLQLTAPPPQRQADLPWLVMKRAGNRYEGGWQSASGEPAGPALKLVRAASQTD